MQSVVATPLQAFRIDRGVSAAAVAAAAGLSIDEVTALERGDLAGFASRHDMEAVALRYGSAVGLSGPAVLDLLTRTVSDEDHALPAADTPPLRSTAVTPSYAGVQVAGTQPTKRFVRSDRPEAPTAPATDTPTPTTAASTAPAAAVPAHAPALAGTAVSLLGVARQVPPPGAEDEVPMLLEPNLPPAEPVPAVDPWATGQIEVVHAARQADPVFRERFDSATSELEAWAAGGAAVDADATWLGTFVRRHGARILGGPERAHRLAGQLDAAGDAARARTRDLRDWMESSSYGSLVVASVVGIVIIATLLAIGGGSDESTQPLPGERPAAAKHGGGKRASSASAKPAPRPVKARAALTIDVLNSGSVAGKAASIADRLKARGYGVREVGNSSKPYPTPVVLYAPRYKREAERMARDAGISTVDELDMLGSGNVKLIVVVK